MVEARATLFVHDMCSLDEYSSTDLLFSTVISALELALNRGGIYRVGTPGRMREER